MDIKQTDSIILNLFHNASTEPKFTYVDCFHGLKTTGLKETLYFDFQIKKLMKRFLFSRVPRYNQLYWIRCWEMLIYEENSRNFWNQKLLYCVPQELVTVLCPTPSFAYPVNSRSILSLNAEEHHCYICVCIYIYIYIYIYTNTHTYACVCVCVCACSRAHIFFNLRATWPIFLKPNMKIVVL